MSTFSYILAAWSVASVVFGALLCLCINRLKRRSMGRRMDRVMVIGKARTGRD